MKIIYSPNPLASVVELDERDIEVLRLKTKIDKFEDIVFSAHFAITRNEWYNKSVRVRSFEEAVAEAVNELNPDYWCSDEKAQIDVDVEAILSDYLNELKLTHVGDCTCVACSCTKCKAESLLGIDTIKGLDKHSAHHIEKAFRDKVDQTRSLIPSDLDAVIDSLDNYNPAISELWAGDEEGFKSMIPRWREQAQKAVEWLKQYRSTHFPNEAKA